MTNKDLVIIVAGLVLSAIGFIAIGWTLGAYYAVGV